MALSMVTPDQDLLTRHLDELRAAAAQLAPTADEAEDLLQECLVAAMRGLDRLRNREVLGAWLLQILRRKWYDRLRRRTRERHALQEVRPTAAGETPRTDADLVRLALEALPAEERRILELRYFKHKTSAEIAAAVGRPAGTVRSMIFYAVRKLESVVRDLSR